jgi:hypothetical protein
METFNPDPKPGRIVLPLVLIGMIATTYTFINRVATNNDLEIVVDETPVETVAEETSTRRYALLLQQRLHFLIITLHTLKN